MSYLLIVMNILGETYGKVLDKWNFKLITCKQLYKNRFYNKRYYFSLLKSIFPYTTID